MTATANVTSKYNFALFEVFREYSVPFTSHDVGEVSQKYIGTSGFRVKIGDKTQLFTTSNFIESL